MSHRQGLHSDDKPYIGEPICYCDEKSAAVGGVKRMTSTNQSSIEEITMKKYQIVVTEISVDVPFRDKEWVRAETDEEGHYEWFDSTRDEKEEVYNQTVESLDLPALVTFINNPKGKEE